MRIKAFLTLAALVALPLFGANETVTLLGAKRVRDVIYLAPDGKTLKVKVDERKSFHPLAEKTTFRAGDGIDLAFEDYNPMKFSITTNETLRDDETAKAVGDFLQQIVDTAGVIGVAPTEVPDAAPEGLFAGDATGGMASLSLEIESFAMDRTDDQIAFDCDNYNKLHEWLTHLRLLMKVPVVTSKRFAGWVNGAQGATGVTAVRADMAVALAELDANAKAIDEVIAAIQKYFAASLETEDLEVLLAEADGLDAKLRRTKTRDELKAKLSSTLQTEFSTNAFKDAEDRGEFLVKKALNAAADVDPVCNKIRASTFAALLDIARDAARVEVRKVAVKKDLAALRNSLEKYTQTTVWREAPQERDYIFLQPKPDAAKVNNIKVSIVERVATKESVSVALTDKEPATGSFDLRKYSAVIPEVAAALIYTDIEYAQFGTGTNETGKTVVERVEPSRFPVEGAMMMNFIPGFMGDSSFVYPTFQLGVSTAKDAPGLLAGLGLRFTGTQQFSIAIGRLVTWHKTLNELELGQVVKGTAEIEADLKFKRAPTAWYGGIQYNF